jgi:lipopolysaccharide biosynthesis glycosyltransferase
MNYQGWALFMDCDMIMEADIAELWRLRDDKYAVQVCKHDYVPKSTSKVFKSNYKQHILKRTGLVLC